MDERALDVDKMKNSSQNNSKSFQNFILSKFVKLNFKSKQFELFFQK